MTASEYSRAQVNAIWRRMVVISAVGEYELSQSILCSCGVPTITCLTLSSKILCISVVFISGTSWDQKICESVGISPLLKGNVNTAML